VVPDRGVPVMSTLRMALTTITAEPMQETGPDWFEAQARLVLPKFVDALQEIEEIRTLGFE
jgi:hypothetical protein